MIVWCNCEDCIHCEDDMYNRDEITIGETLYLNAPARCCDYTEQEDE